MPAEPTGSIWELPDPANEALSGELVGVGADLEPGTLLAAYRTGMFPMPLPPDMRVVNDALAPIGWWSPDPRGVLPIDGLRISRSLRRSCRNFEITIDQCFDDVILGCADASRQHGWIDSAIIEAYRRLHELGWAHSVEVWRIGGKRALVGGLYGVAIGGLFAGESMFHRERDASKVALVALVDILGNSGFTLLDVQWPTDHLQTMGVVGLSRQDYLQRLSDAVDRVTQSLSPLQQPWRLQVGAH